MEGRLTMRRTGEIAATRTLYGKREDRYLELIRRFPLRPLRSDADLDAAIVVVDSLIDQAQLSAPEQDYLDVLSDLVEAYENEAVPMRQVSDAEMLRFLIDQRESAQVEVARQTGIAESTISEVLAGKRKLNRSQIGKLARHFHVEPGVFEFGEKA
jgi:HTH-type transcriptional regulator / antitoxin HigA